MMLAQCVTRDYASAYAVYKIPLAPTPLPTASGTVNNAQFTFTIPQTTTNVGAADVNNLLYYNGLTSVPTRGPVAVSVSGQNMFPMARHFARLNVQTSSLTHRIVDPADEQQRRAHVPVVRDGHVQRACRPGL